MINNAIKYFYIYTINNNTIQKMVIKELKNVDID